MGMILLHKGLSQELGHVNAPLTDGRNDWWFIDEPLQSALFCTFQAAIINMPNEMTGEKMGNAPSETVTKNLLSSSPHRSVLVKV